MCLASLRALPIEYGSYGLLHLKGVGRKGFGIFLSFGYVCSKPSTGKALIEYSMKKVLGLDLGVGSIGWSLIAFDEDQHPVEILGMGCRIVPLMQLWQLRADVAPPGHQLRLF